MRAKSELEYEWGQHLPLSTRFSIGVSLLAVIGVDKSVRCQKNLAKDIKGLYCIINKPSNRSRT